MSNLAQGRAHSLQKSSQTPMPDLQTQAIILKITEHKEADLIVWMLTEDWGRLTLRAPSARKSQKRFIGRLQTFAHLAITFKPTKTSWPVLLDVEVEDLHVPLRDDLGRFASASYLAELMLRLTQEHDPVPDLFFLLRTFLEYCAANPLTPKVLCRLHLRLLQELGLQPNWRHCMECGKELSQEEEMFFELSQGALLCTTCKRAISRYTSAVSLSQAVRGTLEAIQDKGQTAHVSPLHWEGALRMLDLRITHLLGQPPNSRAFLREMLHF